MCGSHIWRSRRCHQISQSHDSFLVMWHPLGCMRLIILVYVNTPVYIRMSNHDFGIGMRSNLIHYHYQDKASPQERKYASALCGGIAGGGVTRLMGTVSRYASIYDNIHSNCIQEAGWFREPLSSHYWVISARASSTASTPGNWRMPNQRLNR